MNHQTDLQKYLDKHEVQAEIIQLERQVRTVQQAAQAVGVSPDQIVKSLLFIAADEPVFVIALGPERVAPAAIARLCQVDPVRVEMAAREQVVALTGYLVGTVPPIGVVSKLRTFIDRRVLDRQVLFAGGGGHQALLKLSPQTLLRYSNGQVVDLGEEVEAGSGH